LDVPADLIMTSVGHPPRVESLLDALVIELSQSGIVYIGDAYRMSQAGEFIYGWFGYIEGDIVAVGCTEDGAAAEDQHVDRVIPCVYAFLTYQGA
jgi:hypothetical protein